MALIETYILVPTHYNDGTPVEETKLEQLEVLYLEKFGGVTIEYNASKGLWKDPNTGTIYPDTHHKFIVALEHWNQVKDLIEIAETIKQELKQEAVYINIAGIPDII